MFSLPTTTTTFLSLLSLTTALAAPMEHRLEDIQCRCLSFSTSAKPTLCTYFESHGLDWHTAYTLASDNDLKIQFASQPTIDAVLAIHKPLPASVLHTLAQGEARPPTAADLVKSENKIVCGLGDEVRHLGSVEETELDPECHSAGIAVGAFMLFLVLYVVGEYVWRRHIRSSDGAIKLDGDEKTLLAATQTP